MAENTNQHHDHPLLLQSLKCPRCDSSNTKFCYYNNYSLSQPRHFCKACKRYWTRGGTLRNVPVGGGCRKNKRVRRQTTSGAATAAETTPHHNIAPPQNYNLTTNPTRLNFPFPAFGSARDFPGNNNSNRGSDFEHQMNGFGMGGSDGIYNNHSLCFGSSPFSNSTSVMGTLLASGVQQPDEIGSIQHVSVSHPQDPCLIWFDPTSMTGSSPSVQSLI